MAGPCVGSAARRCRQEGRVSAHGSASMSGGLGLTQATCALSALSETEGSAGCVAWLLGLVGLAAAEPCGKPIMLWRLRKAVGSVG